MRVWSVARKELREGLRDRRSLMSDCSTASGSGGDGSGARRHGARRRSAVTLAAAGASGAVAGGVSGDTQHHVADGLAGAEAAVRDRRIPVALLIDADYAERFAHSRIAEVAPCTIQRRPSRRASPITSAPR